MEGAVLADEASRERLRRTHMMMSSAVPKRPKPIGV